MLSLAYPVRTFFGQRGEINDVRARKAATAERVRDLEAQQFRWRDPAYVKTQARERLHMVLPGETPYLVLRGPAAKATLAAAGAPGRSARGSWYDTLWTSVTIAGQAASRR